MLAETLLNTVPTNGRLYHSVSQLCDVLRDNYDVAMGKFGLIRCKLDADARYKLHYWRKELEQPTTLIHQHKFNLHSRVLAGGMHNTIYDKFSVYPVDDSKAYYEFGIEPGEGATRLTEPEPVWLREQSMHTVTAGSEYKQKGFVIHKSAPSMDRTITLIHRTHAHLYTHATAKVYGISYVWDNANLEKNSLSKRLVEELINELTARRPLTYRDDSVNF